MKIKYINSTYTFSGQNQGITDLQMRISDKNYKTTKYFNLGGVKTDIEDSYSYRDNAGANETVYADNAKIWILQASTGNIIWGVPFWFATNPNIKTLVIQPYLNVTTNQSSPDTSYVSDKSANINKGTYADAKRAIFIPSGTTNNDIGRILRVEILLNNVYASYINNDNVSLCSLNTLPDSTPTWNETYNTTGVTLATSDINYGFIQTCWMFASSNIDVLVEKWLRSWSTEQKGIVVKFTTENSGGNGEIFFGNQNSSSNVQPIIVVSYYQRRIVQ